MEEQRDVLARRLALCVCVGRVRAPMPPDPPLTLADRGRELFFNETFAGNGRTCATCHRAEDNFGLTPNFIATLPANDPLFVAETNPALNNERVRRLSPFSLAQCAG